jgi:hypothetical protein
VGFLRGLSLVVDSVNDRVGRGIRLLTLLLVLVTTFDVIEARVARGHEGGDLLAQGRGQPLPGGLAPAAVDQAGGPGRAMAGLDRAAGARSARGRSNS